MPPNRGCERERLQYWLKIDKNEKPMLIACQQRRQAELEEKYHHTKHLLPRLATR